MNTAKIKRGVKLILKDTSTEVVCERDRQNGTLFVFDPNKPEGEQYFDVSIDNVTEARKGRTAIQNKPKTLTKSEKEFKKELNVFYASQTLTAPFICENCGLPLYAFTKFEIRCCIAHILEKSKFPSVAIHPMNKLFLCAKGGCHAKYDNSTAKERSELPVYKLAIERYNIFKDFLSNSELIRSYSYLNIKFQ